MYDMILHLWIIKMFINVWSSREYAQVIGKEYGSVENGTNGRRIDIVLLI